MDMDLDNFDFKPLTSGLGFDKKAEQSQVQKRTVEAPTTKVTDRLADRISEKMADSSSDKISDRITAAMSSDMLPSMPFKEPKATISTPELFERSLGKDKIDDSSRTIKDMLNALPPSLDFVDKQTPANRNYTPVGRQEYITPAYDKPKMPLEARTEIATDNILRENLDISLDNTLEKAFPKVGFRKPFFHQTVEIKAQFTPVTASFTSAVIDALVISGLTALFLVSLIVFTKVDLIAVILHTDAPVSVWLEIGAIFMGVYLLYYMCTRGFWGSTLGDWAFDIQLGLESDRLKWYYPALVVLRMGVVALTGFVVLPLVSFFTKKDVIGYLTGIGLYSKNY
ncbi:MAG: hypothetical protein IT287_02360 [Bdellovibrionaceae bacterium]|nr:hypothetical protein [Pseudobdellovibrionaceae bacterium]